MRTLDIYTQTLIHSQTLVCIIVCWFTLSCDQRSQRELVHELTLLQFLYLFDPEACGRTFFYNYTIGEVSDIHYDTVIWTTSNHVAAAFRKKMWVWVCLSVVWSCAAVVRSSAVGGRACGRCAAATLLAAAGVAVLALDLLHAALFIADIHHTATEKDIIEYVGGGYRSVQLLDPDVLQLQHQTSMNFEDTTWLPLAMAFCSVRGLLLWILNFWIIKDNYMDYLSKRNHFVKSKKKLVKSV